MIMKDIYYLKENIWIEKYGKEKYMIIMEHYYLKENIKKMKTIEIPKNMIQIKI